MKKAILLVMAALPMLGAGAQTSKFDATALQQISLMQDANAPASRSGELKALPVDNADATVFLVSFTSQEAAQAYYNESEQALTCRANMVLASLSADQATELAESPEVKSITLGFTNEMKMVDARIGTGVDDVHAGTGLPQAYTGAGVICGMMDTGLDINHANFLDADGKQRTARMWVITGSNGSVQSFTSEQAITGYTTDTSNGTHATHVLGIMGGGYKGTVKQATMSKRGRPQVLDGNCVYYGVAPDATLAPCVGTLQGNNINLAAENLLAYAKSQGKPAVMNLSLGHNTGPHDGTTEGSKYLAELGKEMIICVAAGNEGGQKISYHKDFTAADKTVKTFIGTVASATGIIDVWSADGSAVNVTFFAYDKTTGQTVFSFPVPVSDEGVFLTGSYYNNPKYYHNDKYDDCFGSNSYIGFTTTINPSNGRYNVSISSSLGSGINGKNILPGIIVTGVAGKSVDMYSSSSSSGSTQITSNGIAGYVDGNDSQSISDMACGDNIISVGAYTNIDSWPTVSNSTYKWTDNSVAGGVSNFSSYGKNFAGTQLPFVLAPGQGMRSSYSYYYFNANPGKDAGYVAVKTDAKRDSKWMEMSGTSMATPFMAGVCALWLQADPTLTVDRVKEVLTKTATTDEFTAAAPLKSGVGKVNALAGIKEILNLSGIAGVVTDGADIMVQTDNGRVEVFAAGAQQVQVQLYSVSGQLAAQQTAAGDTAEINTAALAKGVYVLRADAGASRTVTRKIVVK